ncbi:hypothetical protein ABZT49_03915 [Methylobacterium sp. EM32]|uniref:hypothetical protein n=1 Tax=Methylobacterium sp. EM32 TaxID=3163481 RepID=UPI0033A38A15
MLAFGALGLAKDWNEEDHPRDEGGRWTSTDGRRVNHDYLDDGDRAAVEKINAKIDKHLDIIHEARKQSVKHVKALRAIQKTVTSNYNKAFAAANEHYDVFDQYEEGVFEDNPSPEDSDEIDAAMSFRQSLEEATAALLPEIRVGKLKDTGGSTSSSTSTGSTSSAPSHGGIEAQDLSRELAALISGARK